MVTMSECKVAASSIMMPIRTGGAAVVSRKICPPEKSEDLNARFFMTLVPNMPLIQTLRDWNHTQTLILVSFLKSAIQCSLNTSNKKMALSRNYRKVMSTSVEVLNVLQLLKLVSLMCLRWIYCGMSWQRLKMFLVKSTKMTW